MSKSFKKHQYEIFKYCLKEKHPFLVVEMRLGKCLVTIRRCKLYPSPLPVLVVAPSGAIGSWESELTSEGEDFITLDGTTTEKLLKLSFDRDWYLTNKESHLTIGNELAAKNWKAVIIDEAFLRNPKAKVTKFYVSHFRNVAHRWQLAGRPNPENDLEFFSQMQWLDGRAFGYSNYWQFRAARYTQIPESHDWLPKYGTQTLIRQTVGRRACIMSRKDANVEPEKTKMTRYLEFPKTVDLQYRQIENYFELPDGKTTVWSTTKYQWLRQLCGGFIEQHMVWNGKLVELLYLIKTELKDQQVVVWFNYNHEIQYVHNLLCDSKISNCIIWGEEARPEREQNRIAFQKQRFQVCLVQQACAQEGADLSAADTAIFYSEPTGTLASIQTEDRIVNLNKSTALLYIYLTVKKTVDEDLRRALQSKRFTSNTTLNLALRAALEERQNGYR